MKKCEGYFIYCLDFLPFSTKQFEFSKQEYILFSIIERRKKCLHP